MSALEGLRILDLADERGAFCAKLLADMGADVIKIEPPDGDPARETGPFLEDVPHSDRSLSFWYHNTGKRGVTLNLHSGKGQEIFRRLAGNADVVLESFPPRFLEGFGLDYGALRQINPRLIMTSITAFGQTGPYRDYKSCDVVASAMGGQMYVCGDRDTPPLKPYGEQAYQASSIYGAVGTLLALRCCRFNGEGQHVDVSMHECVAGMIEQVNVRYLYEQVVTRRQGSLHWNNAFRLFSCRDGYVLLTLFQQWETLVEWLDSEGMANDLKDERWLDPRVRLEEVEYIIQVLEQWARQHTVAELVEQGQAMHFPWSEAGSVDRLWDNAQLLERGFFVEVDHPEFGTSFKYPGASYKLSESPHRISRRAPLTGEHNRQVYGEELGLSEAEIAALVSEGVI